MMRQHIPQGDLRAYHDGALSAPAQERVEAHLAICQVCRARYATLAHDARQVSDAMSVLRPTGPAASDRVRALTAFQDAITQEREQGSMWKRLKTNRKWLRVAYGLASVAVLAGLLSLSPVRALASEFLSMFRVERFVVVPVGEEQQERLEEISEQLDENFFLGDEEVLQESEHIEVASLDEAASIVGFRPRTPHLTGLGEPTQIEVTTESAMRFTPDLEAARALFEAAGLDPNIVPPEIDGQPFDFHVPASVAMNYEIESGGEDEDNEPQHVLVGQMPSPTADLPPGVDPAALGEAMLQLLGMTPEEAARMSDSIDWTSTLVLPIPADLASYQEITVDGVNGLLFESTWETTTDDEGGIERHRTVVALWEKDGIVNSVISESDDLTLGVANSLQ